ncbi:50S ribosomal protein L6 [Myxococcota bacterium]|nr:50S ribosomal protein L6 [Myxococcota bacterium]MBU1382617.1 50S ribosomal protein L6 [Myxococcota bacterium]MBU1495834.1 50S ribosomal protein L6 [Myxococcota bacterium]
MSRIGKLPIAIPKGLEVKITENTIHAKGKLGELTEVIPAGIKANLEEGVLTFSRENEEKQTRINHGMVRAKVANIVKGLSDGFIRNLNIIGVGYRAEAKGDFIVFSLGYSHPIYYQLPKGVTGEVQDKGITVILKSFDKVLIGQVASEIRALRPPEPYKGKGIRYAGEFVRQKEGKTKG